MAHTQLLWEIACVAACPLHQIEITGDCSCNLKFDPRRRPKRSPGWCPRCGRRLSQTLPKRKAKAEDVRVARLAYELLAEARFDHGGWRESDDRRRAFLNSVITSHFSGKAAWLAKSLGVSKGSLHEWMKGDHCPSLTWLIALAERLGCSVTNILDGDACSTHPPSGSLLRRRRYVRLKVSPAQHERIAEYLGAALSDPSAPSLKAIALRLQVNYDFLRKYFPKQATAIATRCRARLSAQKLAKQEILLAAVRAKAERLAAEGIWPTGHRVMQGIALRARYDRLRPAINAILADTRKRMVSL